MSNLQPESDRMTVTKVMIPTVILAVTFFIPLWYWNRGTYHCQYDSTTNHCECQKNDRPVPCFTVNLSSKPHTGSPQNQTQQKSNTAHWWDPEWLIVYVTGAYAIFACFQWLALSQQIGLAKDTAKRQLRAYICVESSMLKFPPPLTANFPENLLDYQGLIMPGPIEAQVHVKNCGQTPAYEVRTWIHTWYEAHPLRVALPRPPDNFRMASAVLGPGGTTVMIAAKSQPFSVGDWNMLGTPKHTLYVYGEIVYRDAFGDNRYTRYRLIFGGPQGGRKNIIKGTLCGIFNPDSEGNEAD